MDEFLEKLVALRSGIGNLAKGTLENMGNVREREQQMLDAERERNQQLIAKNFGNPGNYEEFLNSSSTPELPKTPGQSLGDFFNRIASLRSRN